MVSNSTRSSEPKPFNSASSQHFSFSSLSWRPHDCKLAVSVIGTPFSPDRKLRQKQRQIRCWGKCLLYVSLLSRRKVSAHFPFYFTGQYWTMWSPMTTKKGWKSEYPIRKKKKRGCVHHDWISKSNHDSSLRAAYLETQTKSGFY